MAEHDADREPQPIDEDAAWAAIVAGYGEEPADPPGAKPFKSVDGLAVLEGERNRTRGSDTEQGGTPESGPEPEGPEPEGPAAEVPPASAPEGVKPPLGGSVVFAPGVGGPRDYALDEPHDDGIDDDDDDGEGHFVPPEPPPLPEADVTTRFAWLAVIGGPLLMLIVILLQWDMTWWLTTLSIGGFLGGFATLVARMQHDEDDDHDDPGRGAVV
ncbi:membrane protein [Streptomyces sp. AcH 505]|uniref:hypothetical protein n=1 Tax=Streptomyces sp. AcH 505 TaxID=352211 RepID=UPI000591E072|nr:membrane protein [Streptomyces sp. AcH 505]